MVAGAFAYHMQYCQGQIDDMIKKNHVFAVTKIRCKYSKIVKKILDKYNIKRKKVYDIDDLNDPNEMNMIQNYLLELTGSRTVPRVFIGGQYFGGFETIAKAHR